jgi:hypothetical protein
VVINAEYNKVHRESFFFFFFFLKLKQLKHFARPSWKASTARACVTNNVAACSVLLIAAQI